MIERPSRRPCVAAATISALAVALPVGASASAAEPAVTIAEVLAEMPEDVRLYNDHLVTLASPFMEGRLPGSRGMAIATEYMEFYFRDAGLVPPFPVVETAADGSETVTERASYRQPFPLGGMLSVATAELSVVGDDDMTFVHEEDFSVTGLGGSGTVTAPITFVGYSIDEGEDGYASYAEGDSLEGRVAMMLRFEPMDENGSSRWGDGRWSRHAGFWGKLRAAADRNPAAVIIVNPPGADDPRAESLVMARGGGGGGGLDVPVVMMTPDAASRLVGAGVDGRPDLLQLRRLADAGRIIVDFDVEVSINAQLDRQSIAAENVAGLLPGRGDLADQYVVVGAHLDHLGLGFFGSRSGPGELHPGADDNASGSAGILLFAKKLAESYDAMPEDADARSVLFIGFTGEESGLNGSRHYVENPIAPMDQHDMMINFDMIGRIKDGRLTVAGTATAQDMKDWITPYFEASPLEVISPERGGGGSDHLAFQRRGVPALFGILADLHGDFHTPKDTSDKINRIGAVDTIRMFHDIVLAAAQRPERWTFVAPSGGGGGPSRDQIKVRLGIRPGGYAEDEPGIGVEAVVAGGSAESAGVLAGDRLVRWDGRKIPDVMAWMEMLAAHEPGDTIMIGVVREGDEVTLEVTLQGKDAG